MSKEINKIISNDCHGMIEELKGKIGVVEVALGMINNTTEHMSYIEGSVQEIKRKLSRLEDRLLNLLESMSTHLSLAENRIITMERRINSLEMKETLLKEGYNSENFKN